MWMLIEYIVPLIISLFWAYELKIMLKINLQMAFPISYMFLALLTYLLYLLEIPVPMYVIIAIFLIVPMLIGYIRGMRFQIRKDDIKIFCIFAFIYSFVFVFDYDRGFTHWDEMNHWGPMVKETLRLNQLYSVEISKLGFHKDYPPIIALFESIWCTLCGGYAEKYIYRALHLLISIMLFTIAVPFEKIKNEMTLRKKITYAFLIVPYIMICAIFTLNDGNIFTTIYTDGVLAITAAFCIYLILSLHKYTWNETAIQTIALAFLMLVKQIGFEYYLLCYLLLVLVFFIDYKGGVNKKHIACKAIWLLGIPILFKMSWSIYVNLHQVNGQFQLSKIDLSIIKAIILGEDKTSWYYTGTVGYLQALLKRPLFNLGEHGISYITMFFVGFMVYLIIAVCNKKREDTDYLWPMIIVYVVGSIGHVVMMWITYMFCYYPGDFLELACYERYMNIIWVVNGIILLFFVLKTFSNSMWVHKLNLVSIVMSVIIIFWSNSNEFLTPILKNNSSLMNFYGIADYINVNTPEDSSVFIVTQGDNGYVLSAFRYLTMPRTYNNDDYSFGEQYSDDDIWTRNYSKEEFLSIVDDYDYMFLYSIDDQFLDGYGDALIKDSGVELEIGGLYKIESDGNQNVRLLLIG